MSMSDAFFGRVFHARRELVPFGTVTTYFHADAEDLAAEDISRSFSPSPTPAPFTKAMGIRPGNSGHLKAACSRPRIRLRISRLSRIQSVVFEF